MCIFSGASSLERRGCHGRAAFDITFQHKTTFSLGQMKDWKSTEFCKVAKVSYWQNSVSNICSKAAVLVFCTECLETQVATSSNANSLYCSL